MKERIAELEKQLKERDEKIAILEQKIDVLMRRLFEATSEKLPPSQDEGKEPGKPGTSSGSDAAPEEDAPKDKPRSKRKKGRKKTYPKNLPIIIDAIVIPDEVAADPDNWEQIGEDYQDLWDMTPAQLTGSWAGERGGRLDNFKRILESPLRACWMMRPLRF